MLADILHYALMGLLVLFGLGVLLAGTWPMTLWSQYRRAQQAPERAAEQARIEALLAESGQWHALGRDLKARADAGMQSRSKAKQR